MNWPLKATFPTANIVTNYFWYGYVPPYLRDTDKDKTQSGKVSEAVVLKLFQFVVPFVAPFVTR